MQVSRRIPRSTFKKLLSESIVEGLESICKEMPRLVLHYARRNTRIKEAADNIEAFVGALEKIFGEGSWVIERQILERLESKVGLVQVPTSDWSLLDYVKLCEQYVVPDQE